MTLQFSVDDASTTAASRNSVIITMKQSILISDFSEILSGSANELIQAEKNCALNPSRLAIARRQRPQIKRAFSNDLSSIVTTGNLSDSHLQESFVVTVDFLLTSRCFLN